MPINVPATSSEANAVGRPFTGSTGDLQKYGFPLETYPCQGAGEKCAVYQCVNGWRLVRYCDGGLGCTDSYEVPC
jgi:hypothetical protein